MTTYASALTRTSGAGTHRDGRPVPRWASIAAHFVPLLTLPAALWRLPLAFGFSMGTLEHGAPVHVGGWLSVYVLSLSAVTEAAAFLTLGLIRPWGERAPAWIPVLGGRRVRPLAAVVPAALGALFLTAIWIFAFRNFPGMQGLEFSHPAWKLLLVVCYFPLLAWGPLLGAVTYAYYRRRCRD